MLISKVLVFLTISLTQQKKNKNAKKGKKIVEEIVFDSLSTASESVAAYASVAASASITAS